MVGTYFIWKVGGRFSVKSNETKLMDQKYFRRESISKLTVEPRLGPINICIRKFLHGDFFREGSG